MCLYLRTKSGRRMGHHFIVVYVDDLTIILKRMRLINTVKVDLSIIFKMKDLGDIHYILKMEVRRNRN
jgi:hypothetical protein